MYFEMDVFGDIQFAQELRRWEAAASDMSPVFEAITLDFFAIEHAQFASQGARSARWQELSDNPPGHGYKSWKSRHYPGQPIMQREGDLMESLTSPMKAARRITADDMFVGTDVSYAVYHQSPLPRTKIPLRRLVSLTESDRRRWRDYLQRFLATGEVGTTFMVGL
jgi:phage gpG-like protein